MTNEPSPSKIDPYLAWRNPNYCYYALSWFLSTFSKEMETVAVGIYLYHRTNNAMSLAWVGLVRAVPVLLLAITGGQMADRFNRRRILMATLFLSLVASAGILFAVYSHSSIGIIYLFLGIGAIAQALGSPSRAAILPQLVSLHVFPNALTWNMSIFQVSMMLGPAVGGLLIFDKNTLWVFVLSTICRVFSFVAIGFMASPIIEVAKESITWESVLAGIRFVKNTKLILATITLDLFAVLLGGATYILPVIVAKVLHADASWVGWLRSAEAIGAMSMAFYIAHRPLKDRAGTTMLCAVAGFGAWTMVLGTSHLIWLSMLAMLLIGALDNISVVVRHTLVQMLTPEHMRGRVSAVNNIFIVASNDIGGWESGVTAALLGPVVAVVAGGAGTIIAVLACAKKWPELFGIQSLNDIRPAEMIKIQEEAAEEIAERN